MLEAMRDHIASGAHVPQIPTAVCSALRRIAVNDDICMEFADAGGVAVTMQVSHSHLLLVIPRCQCHAYPLDRLTSGNGSRCP